MNRSLIYRATTSDPSGHISEYQINQITQLTENPDPTVIPQLISFISHRLSKPDIYIKTRCCKLIRHVAERGKSDFRRLAQRELVDHLRALTTYNAPPHATKGMEPVRQLRQAAHEALSTLFAQENTTASDLPSPSPRVSVQRIEGYGSGSGPSPMNRFPVDVEPGPCISTGKMVGCGNVEYPEPQSGSMLSFRSIIDTISSKLPPIATKWNPRFSATGSGLNRRQNDDLCTYADNPNADTWNRPVWSPNRDLPARQPEPRRPGGAFPSATSPLQSVPGDSDVFNLRQGKDLRRKSYLTPTRPDYSSGPNVEQSSRVHSSSEMTSGEPGDFEVALVERLTEPGGLKLTPPRKALEEFRIKCETLDITVVLLAIFGKLDDEKAQWQQRLRCLCVLETLVNSQDRLALSVREFIKDRPAYIQAIQALEQHHSCRLAAKELASLLDLKAAPQTTASRNRMFPRSSPVVEETIVESFSLLDLDEGRGTSHSEAAVNHKDETSAEGQDTSSVSMEEAECLSPALVDFENKSTLLDEDEDRRDETTTTFKSNFPFVFNARAPVAGDPSLAIAHTHEEDKDFSPRVNALNLL